MIFLLPVLPVRTAVLTGWDCSTDKAKQQYWLYRTGKLCSFVEKVDCFKSYSQYGLTRIITIHTQGSPLLNIETVAEY